MSQSRYENKANNIKEEGNVTPFSVEMDSRAVHGSGSASPIELMEDRGENKLVVYDSKGNDTEDEVLPIQSQPLSSRTLSLSPSIGAFTVQCASCFKWRLMPSMQKYEEIRENLLENPFFCETACEWKPNISCDVPADIYQDGTRLWAIDKPNISRPPTGWQRLLRIRGEGGTRFADVYYVAPSGKKLRSTVEVQKYLNDNPEYIREGVKLSQFSFQIPKPLQDDYVRKRPARLMESSDNTNTHVAKEANPLAWISSSDDHIALQLATPTESGLRSSHDQPSKKKKTSKLSIFGSNEELADR
ncbi:PREDICTED: methyl-CpG-binding domain-containing protein 2-like isoform X1 [Camelina sativa]|uniref:Methyl-CpG-binding domain-containing protein 2-like isoform X1 n=1 Tax=Camelina sativa TaxID=90675 RepID=A0ABM0UG88_CAMSA|nr:PREDICTED: methyl-CpG-binding domain-containing protein 2-like isoform X1 [Camelina sativa]XP_010440702.1 PREDICTED: methyl-CpG-binding domain-containing protein 2-like isoform X1 [Camelina sativa]